MKKSVSFALLLSLFSAFGLASDPIETVEKPKKSQQRKTKKEGESAAATMPVKGKRKSKQVPAKISSFSFEEIEDLSSLPLLNPDLKERVSAKLRLSNGLEALLISDPKASQSAAAVAVKAGSWNDPLEYPGMAHFCEHMLFMGTEKYPSENEFFSLISDYAGSTNAFTAPNRTVYMFASEKEGFTALLDRFAHFFIDPLFNPANIAREMHAVDQEFAKNIENDAWREYMVFKETGNRQHPNRLFSTGNSETLAKIPQSALKEWHKNHYGAEKMHLAIYSPLPIDELKKLATSMFSEVPRSAGSAQDTNAPLTSAEQRGHITYIKPIRNRQLLTFSWELPPSLSLDEAKSAEALAYALKRGQKRSLYELLKNKQLIDGMSIRVDELGGLEHQFFQISLELTRKGIENLKEVGLHIFEAISALKTTGVPSYLFQEKDAIAQLNYQYQSRQAPFEYIMQLGDSLPQEALSTYPRYSLLAKEQDAEKINAAAAFLTPESCLISLSASPEITQVEPDMREQWFGAEYAIRPIPDEWISEWKAAKPNPSIQIAPPNPFVPTRLERVAAADELSAPSLIASTDLGICYYARVAEYAAPESVTHLHILSPEINPTAKSAVLTSLYIDHLTDLLHPTLESASSAGLNCSFSVEKSRIHIQISGFSEKAPLLLQEIVKQMPMDPPTPEQFALYAARHEKVYMNSSKELAVRQAKELLDSLINQDKATSKEKLAALKEISYEDFLHFHKKLFEKTYIEALFAGNLTLKEAQSAWLDTVHIIGKKPYLKKDHPQTKILQLPSEKGPYSITDSGSVQGNAAILLIDEGSFSFEKRALQELLAAALKEPFFNELRSKQKTGYIAQSDCTEIEKRLFQFFLVQSNSHEPEDLLYRFELFLEEFNHSLADNLTLERFETLRQSQISSLKNRCRNLKEKAALLNLLAFQYDADFSFIEKRIKAHESIKYDEFLAEAQSLLSRQNRKRIAVLFKGKLSSPFVYEEVSVSELGHIGSYTAKKE